MSKFEVEVRETLTKIVDKLHIMDITLVKQEVNLKEHMKRTDIQEKRLDIEKTERQRELEKLEANQAEFYEHKNKVEGAGKALLVIATIVAVVSGIIKVLASIHNIN